MTSLKQPGSDRAVWHASWPRLPGAPALPRPPPAGHRPPNGIIWGHTFDEFCWIPRYTNINGILTMWSRSMIKEHGELYTEDLEYMMFENPEHCVKPRRRKVWPALKIKGKGGRKAGREMDPPLGMLDEGSDHENADPREAVLLDSDEEDDESCEEGAEDGPDTFKVDLPGGMWIIPMKDVMEYNDKSHWRRMVTKKRVYETGRTRFYVRPPSGFHSMTLDDIIKRHQAEMEKEYAGASADDESEKSDKAGKHGGEPKAQSESSGVPSEMAVTTMEVDPQGSQDIPANGEPSVGTSTVPEEEKPQRNPSEAHDTEGQDLVAAEATESPEDSPNDSDAVKDSGISVDTDNDVGMSDISTVLLSPPSLAGADLVAEHTPDVAMSDADGSTEAAGVVGIPALESAVESLAADANKDADVVLADAAESATVDGAAAATVLAESTTTDTNTDSAQKAASVSEVHRAVGASTQDDSETTKPEPKPKPKINPFSRKGLPKLQEQIPTKFFPDTLIVHDPDGLSMACDYRDYDYGSSRTVNVLNDKETKVVEVGDEAGEAEPKKIAYVYKRVYPPPTEVVRESKETSVGETDATKDSGDAPSQSTAGHTAHLYMHSSNRLGTGHHSHVYLTPLTLPAPLTTFTSSAPAAASRPGTVLVAAKVAIQQRTARSLLSAEAKTYSEFPQHLSEEYCGLHLLSPFMRTLAPSCAVVPKFYGYYVPVVVEKKDGGEEEGWWQKRSPILLLEDCGTPIKAGQLTRDERSDCYSLLMRLHMHEYLHDSFHERNIVVQPGPLTLPPLLRSMKTPSFRVIDFGRTVSWKQWLRNERKIDSERFKKLEEEMEEEARKKKEKEGEKGAADKKGKRKGKGKGKGKETEKEKIPERGGQGWWDHRKRVMTDEEAMFCDLDENPYWRNFEGRLAHEWRQARKELLFDPVEPI
ncbi:hypothetical protein BXZ70DRAFT_1012604 [Cristinia sonorae]|uniref:Protein kinase domain-containing protein n=1 Tax=Cristinia sonorae TaxID=1940300 RepID=A0A8K0UGB3_9AGAR|nr:hypothetical protein BXZ70DRAFT_1012604 [Cristinia sonorae]